MKNNTKTPLVTISIPTYNSGEFLSKCLDAIDSQSYRNYEINIVDGYSKDNTLEIAQQRGVKIYKDSRGLLNARKIGADEGNGEYTLLLDSDQILEPKAIEVCVQKIQSAKLDMIVLGEDVYKRETLLEKLFQYDRDLVHAVRDFSPLTGVMLPRFYKSNILRSALNNIPHSALLSGGQDHAIIYYEASKISEKVDLIEHIVKHIEPSSILKVIPKFYRWGYTSKEARHDRYRHMLSKKEVFRKGMFTKGLIVASFASILLLAIKGIPFKVGYFASKRENK